MAVDFSGSSSQRINFGDAAAGVSSKLIMFWVYRDDTARGTVFFKGNTPWSQGWAGSFEDASGIKFWFRNWFNTQYGLWRGGTNFSTGLYHVAVHYDWSSTSNDPRIWVNGVLETITEVTTPSGTNLEGTGNSLCLGDDIIADANYAINGKILSYTINNVSGLSDAQVNALVADAYNSRLAVPNYSGLVFAPNLVGAKGIQTFDGATLSSSNTMIDNISGAVGTPSGDPLGAADTYLTYEG